MLFSNLDLFVQLEGRVNSLLLNTPRVLIVLFYVLDFFHDLINFRIVLNLIIVFLTLSLALDLIHM